MSIGQILRSIILSISRCIPVNKKKIIFCSHLGKNYSCNPKYICDYILKFHLSEFKLVYLFDPSNCNPTVFPEGVRPLSIYSKRFLYDIATCGVFISNTRIPEWFNLNPRKGQCYIQTWHSSLRLKMIERDANLGTDYEKWAISDSNKITTIVSGCAFSSKIFSNAFWYDGPLLEVGTPRIDYLLNISDKEKIDIYAKANLDNRYKYVLYAPTFRKGGDLSAYSIDYALLSYNLSEKFGGEWKILFRLHPNLKDKVNANSLAECCIDMTSYSDIQELIVLSDIMITDYSSCMFDMAFMNKLCILYTADLDNYTANERGLYFDITSLPFPLAKNNEELSKLINSYSDNEYGSKLATFMSKIGSFENGNACKEIVDYIRRK